MNAVVAIIGSIAVCGVLAALAMWLTGRGDKKSNVMKALHELTQAKGVEELKKIEGEQETVVVNIKAKETLAIESRKKIDAIEKKASAEIEKVLLEDSLKEIQHELEKSWPT